MKILMDTHAFLWIWQEDASLSESARKIYLDTTNQLFFSAASLWEISIKSSLGKITLKPNWFSLLMEQLKRNSIQWLPITPEHCHQVSLLPFHHRDPFDRMLASQALVDNMKLMSHDPALKAYGVECVW